jgi:hypothetical protein
MQSSPKVQYGDQSLPPSWNLMNFPAIRDWIGRSPERATVLLANRTSLFETVLGTKHSTWTGGNGNHRHAVWRLEEGRCPIWILVSKRGTVYEMEHAQAPWSGRIPKEDLDDALLGLATLYLKLEETEPVQKYGPITRTEDDTILMQALQNLDKENRLRSLRF